MRCILFITAFCVALAGTNTARADESPLRVATFACDITPPWGDYVYGKPLVTIEHPLLAKGVVLDDGAGRYVLCAVDWCILANSSHRLVREAVAKAAGTDPGRVMVQCVHVHTAPIYDADVWALLRQAGGPARHFSDPAHVAVAADRLARAVADAVQRFEAIDQIGTGQARVERVASSRRIPVGNGTVQTRYSLTKDRQLRAAPEGFIDPYLKTITLARGDRPVVRLHYYAVHPQSYYRDGRASYDFVGMARETLEKEEGVFQVYFTGCAGDVAAGKYNDGTPEGRAALAERLLAGMKAAAAATRFAPAGPITWRNVDLRLVSWAEADRATAQSQAEREKPKTSERAESVGCRALANRADQPIVLGSLQIGRVHVVHLPGEPMVAFQVFAQQQLPEDFVAVAGYGDGAPWYLCTEEAFPQGGYEPSASNVVPESEAVLKQAIVELLGKR